MFRNMKYTIISALAAVVMAGSASAATVSAILTEGSFTGNAGFASGTPLGDGIISNGFLFSPANITGGSGDGNCALFGGKCIQLNTNATTTMTTYPPGGVFDLEKLSFVLDGATSELGIFNVTLSGSSLILSADVDPNGPQTCDAQATFCVTQNQWYLLDFMGEADGVTNILFDNLGEGNVRIGAIQATSVPEVPLPAAGWMLLAGIGGIATIRRRRKTRAG